jgi:hypothetical protein
MRLPRVRFTVRRMTAWVVAVALLLTALRIMVSALPHVRQCWKLAAGEERLSQAYRRAASRYRTCVQTVPCSASEYCYNACVGHANALGAGHPAGSDEDRARAAAAHRHAALDHERAADLHAARARLYRQAAFRLSQPLPTWTPNEQAAADVFERYQCDTF